MNASKVVLVLAALLILSVGVNVLFYINSQAPKNTDLAQLVHKFGSFNISHHTYDFSPPVSMYRAITIGLQSDGWNASSLANLTISANLKEIEFTSNGTSSGYQVMSEVKEPAKNWADVELNSTTVDKYVWIISLDKNEQIGIPHVLPVGLYFVSAKTGELLPHGHLF